MYQLLNKVILGCSHKSGQLHKAVFIVSVCFVVIYTKSLVNATFGFEK